MMVVGRRACWGWTLVGGAAATVVGQSSLKISCGQTEKACASSRILICMYVVSRTQALPPQAALRYYYYC